MTDVLQSNRKFRVLNVIDDCDRVAVAQKVAHSMPAERVIRFLEKIIWEKGKPQNIRCDKGHSLPNAIQVGKNRVILYTLDHP